MNWVDGSALARLGNWSSSTFAIRAFVIRLQASARTTRKAVGSPCRVEPWWPVGFVWPFGPPWLVSRKKGSKVLSSLERWIPEAPLWWPSLSAAHSTPSCSSLAKLRWPGEVCSCGPLWSPCCCCIWTKPRPKCALDGGTGWRAFFSSAASFWCFAFLEWWGELASCRACISLGFACRWHSMPGWAHWSYINPRKWGRRPSRWNWECHSLLFWYTAGWTCA